VPWRAVQAARSPVGWPAVAGVPVGRAARAGAAGTGTRFPAAVCHGAYPGTWMAAPAPEPASVLISPVLRLMNRIIPVGRMPSW
jgi:hypothetical protein